MAGNTLGTLFRVTTFGESHGPGLGCVIDGCPGGLLLDVEAIQSDLLRRRPGQDPHVSLRQEKDEFEILSGVFEGRTTGAPLAMWIKNIDARSEDYEAIRTVFRPGHGDYSWWQKYGWRDPRGGGRISARETVSRVAAGAVAKQCLQMFGIHLYGALLQVGELIFDPTNLRDALKNPYFCPEPSKLPLLESLLTDLRKNGDSIGAKIRLQAQGVPAGLGEPVFDKLDAALAHAMMSIPAARAVALGDGFHAASSRGSEYRDALQLEGFQSNHAGGTLAGMSTGQDLLVDVIFKPTSSIKQSISTLTHGGEPVDLSVKGRHDPCVGLRAVPIALAMMALVLFDHLLMHRASAEIAK